MLVGSYPFEDPDDPRNFRKTIGVSRIMNLNLLQFINQAMCILLQRILSVHYSIPDYVRVSMDCRHLLTRIFVASPETVIHLLHPLSIFSACFSVMYFYFHVANYYSGDQKPPLVFKESACRINRWIST